MGAFKGLFTQIAGKRTHSIMGQNVDVETVSITKRFVTVQAWVSWVRSLVVSFFVFLQVPHPFWDKTADVAFYAANYRRMLIAPMNVESGFGLEFFVALITRKVSGWMFCLMFIQIGLELVRYSTLITNKWFLDIVDFVHMLNEHFDSVTSISTCYLPTFVNLFLDLSCCLIVRQTFEANSQMLMQR